MLFIVISFTILAIISITIIFPYPKNIIENKTEHLVLYSEASEDENKKIEKYVNSNETVKNGILSKKFAAIWFMAFNSSCIYFIIFSVLFFYY